MHIGVMSFRPNLPNSLEREMNSEDELGVELYKRAGYTNKSAFVAQAVKEKIEKEKDKL